MALLGLLLFGVSLIQAADGTPPTGTWTVTLPLAASCCPA